MNIEMKECICLTCGVAFCIPLEFYNCIGQYGNVFHCPNSHKMMVNVGKINFHEKYLELTKEVEELKRKNTSLLSQIDQLEARENARNES